MSARRPARLTSGLLLLVACACRAEPIEPEGLRVKFHVTSEEDRPLRYAVVWLQANPTRVVVGQEGKVGGGGSFEVSLSRPQLDTSRLTPKEQLLLGQQERIGPGGGLVQEDVFAPAYRPRVIVFADENANGRLDLSMAEQRVTDPVIAIDGESGTNIALLEDPKAAIARLSLENTAAFYEENPRLSDFVFVAGYGSLSLAPTTTIELLNAGLVQPFAPFCARQLAVVDGGTRLQVHVTRELDTLTACGLEAPTCASFDARSAPAALADEGIQTQCKSNSQLESLTVLRSSFECMDCVCTSSQRLDSFMVPGDSVPDWWPCGRGTRYCEPARGALYEWDYACNLRANTDAGTPLPDAGAARVAVDAAAAPRADAGSQPALDTLSTADAAERTPL